MKVREGADPSDRVNTARFIPGGAYYAGRLWGIPLGFFLGGSVGAVLGFVVGHLLDAYVRPIYSRGAPLRRSRDATVVAMYRLAGAAMHDGGRVACDEDAAKVSFTCRTMGISDAQTLHAGRSLLHAMSLAQARWDMNVKEEAARLGPSLPLRRTAAELVLLFDDMLSPKTVEILSALDVNPEEALGITEDNHGHLLSDWRRHWNFGEPLEARVARRRGVLGEASPADVGDYERWCSLLEIRPTPQGLTRRQIQAAHRKAVMRLHPDRHPDKEHRVWNDRMAEANEARDRLLDRTPG